MVSEHSISNVVYPLLSTSLNDGELILFSTLVIALVAILDSCNKPTDSFLHAVNKRIKIKIKDNFILIEFLDLIFVCKLRKY